MTKAKAAKPVASIADLTPDPQNARKHNPRNIGQVQNSLQKYGAARSIVIDENNQIIAGNGLVEAAALAGIEKVQVVEADGETIIAVRRTGLTKKQKRELGVADNRSAELAEWNPEILAGWKAEGDVDLEQFWRDEELARTLGQLPDVDMNEMWKGMPEFEQEDQLGAHKIIVHFSSLEDVKAFSELVEQPLTDKTRYIWFPKQEPHNLKQYRMTDEP